MCGIAGIISNRNREFELSKMLAIQNHRGPDFTGTWKSENAFIGHNRLSIIDLKAHSNQPFISENGRYILTFNGEIYNYLELKKELSNVVFKTDGDTEVLLAAFEKWGIDCVKKFRGMFAFAIWDTYENELWLARDRFGVKPLHYSIINNEIVFASEIKAILASNLVLKNWNLEVWANYLNFAQYNTNEDTFYTAILQVEAGTYLHIKNHQITKTKYYNFKENLNFNFWNGKTEAEIKEIVSNKLKESLALRLRADVKRGFNLSGGIDSTLLFSILKDQLPANITKAFTFYCNDERYDELEWVNQIVEGSNYGWDKCLLDINTIDTFAKKIQWHQDEPYAGIATLAYARTFEEARKQNYIVVLDGSGMDEQMGGYDYYYNNNQSLVQGVNTSPVRSNVLNREFNNFAKKQSYPLLFNSELLNLQYRDLFYTKLPRDLRMTDRISMAFSTEMREPFMDHELIEMCFSLPENFKHREGQRKWLMRKIVQNYVNKPLVSAPKRPIQTPQREWLSGNLKDWVYETATKGATATNWINKTELDKELNLFFTKDNSNSFYIWQWVSIGLLHE